LAIVKEVPDMSTETAAIPVAKSWSGVEVQAVGRE